MKINVLENTKYRLVMELEGATHTICGALQQELWNDKNVKAATYHISHPLIGKPRFVVETSGSEAKKAVVDALKRLDKVAEKLKPLAVKIK